MAFLASPVRATSPAPALRSTVLEGHLRYTKIDLALQGHSRPTQLNTLINFLTTHVRQVEQRQLGIWAYARWFRDHFPREYHDFLTSFAWKAALEQQIVDTEGELGKQQGLVNKIQDAWPRYNWNGHGTVTPSYWSERMLRTLAYIAKRKMDCGAVVVMLKDAVRVRRTDRKGKGMRGVPMDNVIISRDLELVRARLEREGWDGDEEEGREEEVARDAGSKRKRPVRKPIREARDEYRARFGRRVEDVAEQEGEHDGRPGEDAAGPAEAEGGPGEAEVGRNGGGASLPDISTPTPAGNNQEEQEDDDDDGDFPYRRSLPQDPMLEKSPPPPHISPPALKRKRVERTGDLDEQEMKTLQRLLRRQIAADKLNAEEGLLGFEVRVQRGEALLEEYSKK